MEGFLIFAGLVLAVIVFTAIKDKITGSITSGLNRSVLQRGAYRDQQDLLGTQMHFRTAGDPALVMNGLLAQAPLVPERPRLNPDLYLVERTATSAVICLGNFMQPEQIRIELWVSPTPTPGITEGAMTIPSWIEFDGVANGIRKVKEFRRRLVETMMRADPTATVDGVPPINYLARHHS